MKDKQPTKRRNIADTSRKAYHEIVEEGIPEAERNLVVRILKADGPITSRQLSITAKKRTDQYDEGDL
jgi:hypothetical protein